MDSGGKGGKQEVMGRGKEGEGKKREHREKQRGREREERKEGRLSSQWSETSVPGVGEGYVIRLKNEVGTEGHSSFISPWLAETRGIKPILSLSRICKLLPFGNGLPLYRHLLSCSPPHTQTLQLSLQMPINQFL